MHCISLAILSRLSQFPSPASTNQLEASQLSDNSSIYDILVVCDQYGLIADDVHTELLDFRSVYRVCMLTVVE